MRIDVNQAAPLFVLASDKLGSYYRHERGHKVMTGYCATGIVTQAVFTDVVPGVRCELSMWSENRMRGLSGRKFLRAVFDAAFNQWGVQRVSAIARESNTRSHDALTAMGFRFEAPLRAWYGNEDGWMFYLLRRDCRWLQPVRT